MKIKVLGAHNTESLHTRHVCLIIDDCLALDAGGLTSSLSFDDQMKIKSLLISHAHYDHIRDIPAFAMNLFLRGNRVDLHTQRDACKFLTDYLLNGKIYPDFHQKPESDPTLRLHILEPGEMAMIDGYEVLAVPVMHSIPALGFQVTSKEGKTIFYSGDTGICLSDIWQRISPQILFIEVTTSDEWIESARKTGHLSPALLKEELINFRQIKGYLPEVIALHINPVNETVIKSELAMIADSLGANLRLGYEGMQIQI